MRGPVAGGTEAGAVEAGANEGASDSLPPEGSSQGETLTLTTTSSSEWATDVIINWSETAAGIAMTIAIQRQRRPRSLLADMVGSFFRVLVLIRVAGAIRLAADPRVLRSPCRVRPRRDSG